MEKRKKLQAKIVSASNDKFVIRIGDISKTPKVGDSLVVTIPSRAKVEMVKQNNQTTTSNFPCNFNFTVSNMNRFNQGIDHG